MVKEGSYGILKRFHITDYETGAPIPLQGLISAKLIMKIRSQPIKTFDCIVEDYDEGIVSYTVKEGDFDHTGPARYEIELLFEDKNLISEDDIEENVKQRLK